MLPLETGLCYKCVFGNHDQRGGGNRVGNVVGGGISLYKYCAARIPTPSWETGLCEIQYRGLERDLGFPLFKLVIPPTHGLKGQVRPRRQECTKGAKRRLVSAASQSGK